MIKPPSPKTSGTAAPAPYDHAATQAEWDRRSQGRLGPYINISQGGAYGSGTPEELLAQQDAQPYLDQYAAADKSRFDARNSASMQGLKDIFGSFGYDFGGGGSSSGGFFGDSSGSGTSMAGPMTNGRVAGVDAPDMTEANAQIFGRAKDQAGQMSRASLQSLRDELGATGMLGSGAEAQGSRDIIAHGAGQLGEVSRENAVNESSQKADFAKMKYQGDITQRGQDIAAQEAEARLALQREVSKQQMLMEALKMLNGGAQSGTVVGNTVGYGQPSPPQRGLTPQVSRGHYASPQQVRDKLHQSY